ncbi:MAG: hypothetical protein HOQ22_10355 [Nocardioidaceae bacterium]|nr:hypothetical protein [Nocardioidaceae bacterium]NUS51427.1 hypothetical protein [Nocardioidaceae bacterium]
MQGYQVWRRAYWKRPALLLLYGVLSLLVGLALVLLLPVRLAEARAMEDADVCRTAGQSRCLSEVRGYLDGPRYARGPGSRVGRVWGNQVVAVELPDGRVVRTDEYGPDGLWTCC